MTEEEQFKGALYAETSTLPTLYEKVTHDAERNAKVQQYARTSFIYGTSAVGLFAAEFAGISEGGPDVGPLDMWNVLLSGSGIAIADLLSLKPEKGGYNSIQQVPLDDVETVEKQLKESTFVSYDTHHTADRGFHTGPEAAEEYSNLLSELQQLYETGPDSIEHGVDIYGQAFLERYFSADRAEEIAREFRDSEIHQIVQWDKTRKDASGENPILGDEFFRVEVYAGDNLVASYAGAADTRHVRGKQVSEKTSHSLAYVTKRDGERHIHWNEHDYKDVLKNLGWEDLRKTDDTAPLSTAFVPVLIRDGIKGTAGIAKDIVYDRPRSVINWSKEQLTDEDIKENV